MNIDFLLSPIGPQFHSCCVLVTVLFDLSPRLRCIFNPRSHHDHLAGDFEHII